MKCFLSLSKKECGDYLHALWAIPEKIQKMRNGISRGIEEHIEIKKGSSKKEWNFHLIKKQSFELSMGLAFWSWNSQGL